LIVRGKGALPAVAIAGEILVINGLERELTRSMIGGDAPSLEAGIDTSKVAARHIKRITNSEARQIAVRESWLFLIARKLLARGAVR
jgi:hypothetical protein